jgi:hypothetical protein
MKFLLLLCLVSSAAFAQADGGTAADDDLQKELERAIQSDKAAQEKQGQQQPAPAAATQDTPAPTPQSLLRGTQSLNPDISAILDADFGFWRRPPSFLNGDDPDLGGAAGTRAVGAAVQEVEVALSAIVDPYFKGEVYLTIPNLEGLEVEEAFATTTSLPWSLQVRAGSFRSVFGRQNGQHLHVQDFSRRPLINAAFLGADGLRGPAAEVSWLAPLPFFLTLYGEVYSLRADALQAPATGERPAPTDSFGNDGSRTPTFVGAAKVFVPLAEDVSVYAGLSYAHGESPGVAVSDGVSLGRGRASNVFGADLYVKWKPPNVAGGYASLAWQTEAIFRRFDGGDGLPAEWDGGFYSQLVYQFSRRWFFGVRGEMIGVPSSSVLGTAVRAGASLTFQASEFARVRGYADDEIGDVGGTTQIYGPLSPRNGPAAFLQLEISIGAHGAHPF